MAIGTAVQRGPSVYVYDENGKQLSIINAGHGPNDRLMGYTSSTVSVRRGASIYTFDERGRQRSVISAK
jgi:hypothetical protein